MSILLTQTGVPTVTFARGRLFPMAIEEGINQRIEVAEDGTPQVTELGPTIRQWTVELTGVNDTVEAAFRAFMEHANQRWALKAFTLTDETNTAYTVRYWGPFPYRREQYAGNLWRLLFLVREEP